MRPSFVIRSSQNDTFKKALRLRDARSRRRGGEFLIDGWIEVQRALANGIVVRTLFVGENELEVERLEGLASASQVLCQSVAAPLMQKLRYGNQNTGPVAVAEIPAWPLESMQVESRDSLFLVLDRTEKPGNIGACLRTAAASGASGVVLTDPICELFNPNVIRASRGTIFTLPIAVTSREEFCGWAAKHRLRVWTARVDGSSSLWQCNFREPTAIVFGNEATGLDADWGSEGPTSTDFKIPMRDRADSLNLSISAAVTLYEAVRQREAMVKFDAGSNDG